MTRAWRQTSSTDEYFAIHSSWFAKYVSIALGELHECYVGKIGKESDVLMLVIRTVELPIEYGVE